MLTANKSIVKKGILIQVTVIASVLYSLGALGQTQSIATPKLQSAGCKPIAKILQGDRYWPNLSKVCKEAKINPSHGATVEVLCYLRGNILHISGGTIGSQCLSSKRTRGCNVQVESSCLNLKGPDDEPNAPTLITPYGVSLINPRPMFSWASTPQASNYIVQVKGVGVSWSMSVQNTRLPYPKDQPVLQPGNVYDVNIIAKQGEKFIAFSTILLLVPENRAQQIITIIKRLQSLKQSPDEIAIDMDAVYEAQNLVNEAIEVLYTRTQAGSRNPTIYRLLGDRYLEGGSPDLALPSYASAIALAQKVSNADELAKAQAGVKIALKIRSYINSLKENNGLKKEKP